MTARFDVLGLGIIAVDDLLLVDTYPPADAKRRVTHSERQCGGLTGTALVAAARLGCRCAYAGMLGGHELSRFALETFRREGVNVDHVVERADARPGRSVIIVAKDEGTRNVFSQGPPVAGAARDRPPESVIRSAKVLFVDGFGLEGMIRAATIARDAAIPVVGDFEHPPTEPQRELIRRVDHLIVPRNFLGRGVGDDDLPRLAEEMVEADRQVVVITDGVRGCWYACGRPAGPARHQPAFEVDTVDTTGCGDVFHGAYAAALARGLDVPDRIRMATAAAALKAAHPGGQAGIPTREKVEAFLREHDG